MPLHINNNTGDAYISVEGSEQLLCLSGPLAGFVCNKSADIHECNKSIVIDSFTINKTNSDYPKVVSHKNGFLLCVGYDESISRTRTICYFLGLNPHTTDGPFDKTTKPGKIITAPEHVLDNVSTPLTLASDSSEVWPGRFKASIRTNEILEQANIDDAFLAPVAACVFSCEECGADLSRSASNLAYRYSVDERIVERLTIHALNHYDPGLKNNQSDLVHEPEQQPLFAM